MLRKWGTLALLLVLITPMLALAQNTGKLAGRVTDGETGEPLPGASIVLVGTQLGTITDVDGNYVLLGVPVGTYDVQASFVGYQTVTQTGVEINAGYTRELNFTLNPGVQLDEIVVEYERPLIQKDAVGAPKIVSAEEIVNLPVRGVTSVAAIQAGVVNKEGSGALHVRGGRDEEVVYYIDGVKVIGSISVPQSAIQEQEMIIGNISARYGDAMSGVISITTKSGSPKFFGSIEGITSEALDPYGYNLVSGSFGGPIVPNKLQFFLAGEYTDQLDSSPRASGVLKVNENVLANLRQNPQVLAASDADGNRVWVELPGSLGIGATLPVDDNGNLVVNEDGTITASDGTVIRLPEGADPASLSLSPTEAAGVVPASEFFIDDEYPGSELQRFSLDGNLTFSPSESIRIRTGGRYIESESQGISTLSMPFAPESFTQFDRQDWQFYTTWTHYLSNSTFYQLQVDFSDRKGWNHSPNFGRDIEDILFYGDIDHPSNELLTRYKALSFVEEERVVNGETVVVDVPTYTNFYKDGIPSSKSAAGLVRVPGGLPPGYAKFHNQQFRVSATATTQLGLHQLEFGGEYEQRTNRLWSLGTGNTLDLAGWYDDSGNCTIGTCGSESATDVDGDGTRDAVTRYDQLPFQAFGGDQNTSYNFYGYNYLGTEEVDDESLAGFQDRTNLNVKPWQPIYYGGYIQDKIEFRDIVLNLGLRVDVFDNNTRVYRDKFARLPIVRAGDIGSTPAGIGSDYAVYCISGDCSSPDRIVGYRDLNGNFYDANGQQTQAGNVVLVGRPQQSSSTITEDVFKDYEPQVTVMPRIGVSFPVTDQALFFARYGIVSQRPSEANFESMARLLNRRVLRVNNPDLKPQETIEYELGFRQRLGARAALTISGFYRQIKNLAQLRIITNAFPNDYTTFENVDFGTVKGMELGFDLRRTNNVSVNANYTLSFAAGTGSNATTTSTIVWVNETQPNFISPLDFDQRHRINLSVDYRLGEGEGPTVGGVKLLQNFGVNMLFTAGSGFPYTRVADTFPVTVSRAPLPVGGVNEARMPWTSRVDLRVDRRFPLGNRANLSAFLWVQNLLDAKNVLNVWRATGLPDNDGFLATDEGQQFLAARPSPETAEVLYRHRNRVPSNFGIPRMIRLGFRLDF